MINNNFDWNVDKVNNTADLIRLVLAIVSGIKLLVGALGYNFFTDELLVALENLVPVLIVLYTTWRNNYITTKGKAQKLALAKEGLIEESPNDIIKK